MERRPLNIVILGLSITSSWGNGHATTFRGLMQGLTQRGHQVLFLERDVSWYAATRDLDNIPGGRIALYADLDDLAERFRFEIARADVVIMGSYVPEGIAVAAWVLSIAEGITAFYDIDTPVTLAKMKSDAEYLTPEMVPRFQLYLSFTGGPTLNRIEREFGSPRARALYCSVDPAKYHPESAAKNWELGFLGTYSADRQVSLEKFLFQPARHRPEKRFAVAGAQYPINVAWPDNVEHIEHLSPKEHCQFYNQQFFTLNLTRADMITAGWSPSVRLFEAAACGIPIISDYWPGLGELFEGGTEILIATDPDSVLRILNDLSSETAARIGNAARKKILENHTSAHRAKELENYLYELMVERSTPQPISSSASP